LKNYDSENTLGADNRRKVPLEHIDIQREVRRLRHIESVAKVSIKKSKLQEIIDKEKRRKSGKRY